MTPTVTVIVAAHDEEVGDRPPGREPPRARLPARARRRSSSPRTRRPTGPTRSSRSSGRRERRPCPAAAVPARRQGAGAGSRRPRTSGEIVAFSDANATLGARRAAQARPQLRRPRRRLRVRPAACSASRRDEPRGRLLALRGLAPRAGVRARLVTGGNGAIYAVRRADYVEVDPRFGHDLSLPYLMVQRGRRAVYEPEAHAFEKPSRDLEDEYRRKVRMFEHCWLILLRGRHAARRRAVLPRPARLPPGRSATAAAWLTCPARDEPPARPAATGSTGPALAAQLAGLVARGAGAPARRRSPVRRSPTTTCSSRRRPSSPSSATCATVSPRSGRRRRGPGEPALDVAGASTSARAREPGRSRRRDRDQARGRRAGPVPAAAGRPGRRASSSS